MTVSELIAELQKLPAKTRELPIWVEAEERARPLESVDVVEKAFILLVGKAYT